MLKQQGKSRQSNIFESVAANLKNLAGGVDMCFELMAAPFPSQGNNSALHWKHSRVPTRLRLFKKKLYWSSMQASRISLQHTFTKIVRFPF